MNHSRLFVFNTVTKVQIIFFSATFSNEKKSLLFGFRSVIPCFLDLHQSLFAIR